MDTTERLDRVGIRDEQWRTSAMRVLYEGEEREAEIAARAKELQQKALANSYAGLQELREHVGQANQLDTEAFELHGADLDNGGDDIHERTARRIMHLAGRTALNNIKSRRRRETAWVKAHHATEHMIG